MSFAALITYTLANHVNAIVPYEIAGWPSVTMQVQYQGRSRHCGGYRQPINSDGSDSIAVQTHRRQHKGRTFRQERLREIEKKSDAAETRQFSFAYVDALRHASRLVRNGIEFHLKPCTDRVAATTPFALAEGDFLNPADGKASN